MTSTPRAVRRYDAEERTVYRAAVSLTRDRPLGFTVEDLAECLDCDPEEAREWYEWLRLTGDFDPTDEPPDPEQ